MGMNIFSIGIGSVRIGTLDIVCAAILIMAATTGWQRGFMRSLIGLMSFAAAVASALLLRPVLTEILMGTSLSGTVYGRVFSGITAKMPSLESPSSGVLGLINNGAASAADGAADLITKAIIGIVAFAVVFLAVRAIVLVASKILITVTKLPVIDSVDKILGLLTVTFKWAVLIYIVLVAALVFTAPEEGGFLSNAVNNSQICRIIQNGELLRKLFLN